jgi:ATP-dependent Clp protease protease subunit
MNNIEKDFRLFAKSQGVSTTTLDSHIKNIVTPTIVEERQLNVAVFDVFSRLVQDRIIFLSGEVSETSMDTVVAQLLYLDSVDNRDIHLYINSPGGNCYAGLELVSVMDFIKSDVTTTVLGLAASMGSVIASNGTKGKRYALPYSRVMLHQPSSSQGYERFTDSKIHLQEVESVRNDLYEVLARNSGKSFEEIVELCEHGDKWLKGQEAVELGLIDQIIMPKR